VCRGSSGCVRCLAHTSLLTCMLPPALPHHPSHHISELAVRKAGAPGRFVLDDPRKYPAKEDLGFLCECVFRCVLCGATLQQNLRGGLPTARSARNRDTQHTLCLGTPAPQISSCYSSPGGNRLTSNTLIHTHTAH
jgi:hypothetical protein